MEATANSKELLGRIKTMLSAEIDEGEREAIALLLLEFETGATRTQLMTGDVVTVNEERLAEKVSRINQSEPVQYVLGEGWFFDRRFRVNQSVLIPRPETEMIVRTVIDFAKENRVKNILDIGTGSGCLAVTLALEIKGSKVTATDVSPGALWVAATNAIQHMVSVNFINNDILSDVVGLKDTFDVIVSNPPYVARSEAATMAKHVKDFEPGEALFVPDNDPLIFYKAIAAKALQLLNPAGVVIVEINERFGREVSQVFSKAGFGATEILKDINEKDRIVAAVL